MPLLDAQGRAAGKPAYSCQPWQNHSTLHQTLSSRLQGKAGLHLPLAQPAKLEIQSDTEMNVEGNAK